MNLMPIIERELMIGARSKGTYRGRCLVGALALAVLGWIWLMYRLDGGAASGEELFEGLSWALYVVALFAGVVLTADKVSQERREGTLGLLFLTRLRSYDVAGGVVGSSSLKAAYGLLATIPALTIPVLMGGCTGGSVARVMVGVFNTFFFSVALGLLISTIKVGAFRARSYTFFVLAGFGLFARLMCFMLNELYPDQPLARGAIALFTIISPYTMIELGIENNVRVNRMYFYSLAATHASAWMCVLVATWRLGFIWKVRTEGKLSGYQVIRLSGFQVVPLSPLSLWERVRVRVLHFLSYLLFKLRGLPPTERGIGNGNPIEWLGARHIWGSMNHLILTLIGAGAVAFILKELREKRSDVFLEVLTWSIAVGILHLVVLFRGATQSAAQIVEDRETGAMDVILTSPLAARSVAEGYGRAWWRLMLGPMVAIGFLHAVVLVWLVLCASIELRTLDNFWAVLQGLFFVGMPELGGRNFWIFRFIFWLIAGTGLGLACHWLALRWVGLWLAMSLRRPARAPWIALGLVGLAPWPFFTIAIMIGVSFEFNRADRFWSYFCLLTGLALNIGNDLLLSWWARKRLGSSLRLAATDWESYRRTRLASLELPQTFWRTGVAIGSIAALVWGIYRFEYWRGVSRWEAVQAKARAARLPLSYAELKPLLPPASSNMAAEPILADLVLKPYNQNLAPPQDSAKLEFVNVSGQSRQPWERASDPPGYWSAGEKTDLNGWKRAFINRAGFDVPAALSPPDSILYAFERFGPELAELEEALERPAALFPINYRQTYPSLPHLRVLENLAELLQLKAVAELESGQVDAAFRSTRMAFRLADALAAEPFLFSQAARARIVGLAMQPLWEGTLSHQWTPRQLRWFETNLASVNLLEQYPKVISSYLVGLAGLWERAAHTRGGRVDLDLILTKLQPAGWSWQKAADCYEKLTPTLLSLVDPGRRRVCWNMRDNPEELLADYNPQPARFRRNDDSGLGAYVQRLAFAQACLHFAAIAAVLERRYLEQGAYPESLQEALSGPMKALLDPMTGHPLVYKRTGPESFLLYSIGWNLTDDQGKVHIRTYTSRRRPMLVDLNWGDWVWRHPAPAEIGERRFVP